MRRAINNFLGMGIGAVIAGSGIASLLHVPGKAEPLSLPYEWVAGSLAEVFLGMVMVGYYQRKYRGGLYTGLGAAFASMALFDVGDFLQKGPQQPETAPGSRSRPIRALVVTSVLLLAAGHTRHKRLRAESSS